MSWISSNIKGIHEIIQRPWTQFKINGGYNSEKYPEDVYKRLQGPESINGEWITEALAWKYGKWRQRHDGKRIPGKLVKTFTEFVEMKDLLNELTAKSDPTDCPRAPATLPATSAIFLSHLMFSDYWAIYDRFTGTSLNLIHRNVEQRFVKTLSKWHASRELNELEEALAIELEADKRDRQVPDDAWKEPGEDSNEYIPRDKKHVSSNKFSDGDLQTVRFH